ncbi:MAG: hypothetical protein JXR82_01370 [Marinifilaceae bacterium]|nr:hypothetical protein [Marinifilaceae bacterium]
MAKDANTIIQEIHDHLVNGCGGGNYSDYYVGITKDINERLFGAHKVPTKGHCYIYREAYNDTDARVIEKYYLNKGMRGGDGGGDRKSVFVYVYKISRFTVESISR